MENKLYICNQEKCENCTAYEIEESYRCKYTHDKQYALHKGRKRLFKKEGEYLVEVDYDIEGMVVERIEI